MASVESIESICKWQWQSDSNCTERWVRAFRDLQELKLYDRLDVRPFTVHKLPKDVNQAMLQLKDYKPMYVLLRHERSDYDRHIDTLADAFTELERLSARNSFCQYSPREYFEKIDSTQTRDAVFRNTCARECTSFRPANCVLIKQLLFGDQKNISVLDPFAGWGDRAIGFAAAGCKYVGMDLNSQLQPGYRQLIQFMESHQLVAPRQIRLYHGDSSVSDFGTECYDLVFTCPPYADLEIYQDSVTFETSRDWSDRVLLPTFRSAARAVKHGGYVVVMINVKESHDTYVHDLHRLLGQLNFRYCGLVGSASPTNDRPQGMFVFYRNDLNVKNNCKWP